MSGLPTELWRQIIRHAVHVPQLADTSWDYNLDEGIWQGWTEWEKRRRHNSNQNKAKLTIVLVCRTWRELGLEYLFESIRIWSSEDGSFRLRDLVDLFDESVNGVGTAPGPAKYGYGWWTKRIDCHPGILLAPHVENLFALLQRCYNLQTFVMPESSDIPAPTFIRLVQVLQSRFPNSLRRLVVPPTEANTPLERESLLPIVPLTSLNIRVREPELDFPLLSTFETITTLTIGFLRILTHTPQWYFPRLRSLGLTHLGESDFPSLQPFIERHNSTLCHLFLHISHSSVKRLPFLISGLSNLQSLAFDDLDLKNLAESVDRGYEVVVRGVTHLGVISIDGTDSPDRINGTAKRIFRKRVFPDLMVIRALSEVNPVSNRPTIWSETIEVCQSHGVRLEDLNGRLLAVETDVDDPAPS